jgi:hypothetical protein
MKVIALFLGITFWLGAVTAMAQTISEASSLVRPGDEVSITTVDGKTVNGRLVSMSLDVIALVTPAALELHIDQVRQIDKLGDSVNDGFKRGAIVGAVFGAVNAVAVLRKKDMGLLIPKMATAAVEFGLIGMLVDRLHKGRTTVYRASAKTHRLSLVPLATQGRRGLALTVDWR